MTHTAAPNGWPCAIFSGKATQTRCRLASRTRARFGHADDGSDDELRSRSGKTEKGLGGEPALEGYQTWLRGRGGRAPARLGAHRAHARPPRRGKALEAGQRRAVREHARRD